MWSASAMPPPVLTYHGPDGTTPAAFQSASSLMFVPESSPRETNAAAARAIVANAARAFGEPLTRAGSLAGPTTMNALCITRARDSPRPFAMYASSAPGACTSSTSASPRSPIARAAPVPTAIVFTWNPEAFSNAGTRTSSKPVSWVLVVVAELGLHRRTVGGAERVHRHPLRGQLADQRVVELHHVDALAVGELRGIACNHALHVARELVPPLRFGEEPVAAPHVAAQAQVLLHFEEPRELDVRQRVLLAVDDARLQRRVELAEVQRRRRGADRLEDVERHAAVRRANLEAGQIVGSADRLGAGRDLAHPVLPDLVERVDPLRRDLAAHVRTQLAVERTERGAGIGERVPDALDRRDRDDAVENPAVERHDLERTRSELLQHRRVAAELIVREDRDVEPPVGLLADGVPQVFHRDAQGMVDRLIRAGLAGEVGSPRRRTDESDRRERCGGRRDERTALRTDHACLRERRCQETRSRLRRLGNPFGWLPLNHRWPAYASSRSATSWPCRSAGCSSPISAPRS